MLVAQPFEAFCMASSERLTPAVQEWRIDKACINGAFRKCFVFWLININCLQNGVDQLIIHLPYKVVIAIRVGRPFHLAIS